MLQYSLCAFLAPALVSAYAFPWAGPEPTLVVPEQDNWSPAPTQAPGLLVGEELFRRDDAGDNTCGYISGVSASSLTCRNPSYVCATNSVHGVHGCCNPSSISSCTIPTTCIPSSALSASCNSSCSTNSFIAKCTAASAPYCYQWLYVYSTRTVLTEYGCAASSFTLSVQRTFSGSSNSSSTSKKSEVAVSFVTVTASGDSKQTATNTGENNAAIPSGLLIGSASATPTSSDNKKSTPVGAIVGGVVGGVAVLGALAFGAVFLILRSRKKKQNAANTAANVPPQGPAPGVGEYKPVPNPGYPSPGQQYGPPPPVGTAGYYNQNEKPGYPHLGVPGQEVGGAQHPYSPPGSPAPQYSGPMNPQAMPAGVAEAGGASAQYGQQQQQQPQQYQGQQPQQQQQQFHAQPSTHPQGQQQQPSLPQQQSHQVFEAPA